MVHNKTNLYPLTMTESSVQEVSLLPPYYPCEPLKISDFCAALWRAIMKKNQWLNFFLSDASLEMAYRIYPSKPLKNILISFDSNTAYDCFKITPPELAYGCDTPSHNEGDEGDELFYEQCSSKQGFKVHKIFVSDRAPSKEDATVYYPTILVGPLPKLLGKTKVPDKKNVRFNENVSVQTTPRYIILPQKFKVRYHTPEEILGMEERFDAIMEAHGMEHSFLRPDEVFPRLKKECYHMCECGCR